MLAAFQGGLARPHLSGATQHRALSPAHSRLHCWPPSCQTERPWGIPHVPVNEGIAWAQGSCRGAVLRCDPRPAGHAAHKHGGTRPGLSPTGAHDSGAHLGWGVTLTPFLGALARKLGQCSGQLSAGAGEAGPGVPSGSAYTCGMGRWRCPGASLAAARHCGPVLGHLGPPWTRGWGAAVP